MLFSSGNPYQRLAREPILLGPQDFSCTISERNLDAVDTMTDWAVIHFMAADNNLAAALFDVVLELKKTGSNEQVHLCVFFDGPLLTDSFLARLNPGASLEEDIFVRFGELPTNRAAIMKEIIKNFIVIFPANRRLLIFAGHGYGWRGLLPDENMCKTYLRTGQLQVTNDITSLFRSNDSQVRGVLQQIRDQIDPDARIEKSSIDIVLMNACFMGNLEALASLMGIATIIIASEDADIAETYDYNGMVRYLTEHPGTSPEQMAGLLMNERRTTAPSGVLVPSHSAYAVSEIPDTLMMSATLAQALAAFLAEGGLSSINTAFASTFHVSCREFKDLKGIALNLLRESSLPSSLRNACEDIVVQCDKDRLILATDAEGGRMSPNGISIYCPPPQRYQAGYRSYLEQNCPVLLPWQEFLMQWYAMLQRSCRESQIAAIWG